MADMTNNEEDTARTALILYGSETGNSQEIADELGRLTERLHFTTQVSELNDIETGSLHEYTLTIFALSTTGQGDVPPNGQRFWKSLLLKRLPATFLEGVNFVLFGLGDSSYPKFNWASRKLYKRLLQLGANEVYPRGEADEQHPEGLEGTFMPWALDLRKHLLAIFPLRPGQQPIPDNVQLPPKWVLTLADLGPNVKEVLGEPVAGQALLGDQSMHNSQEFKAQCHIDHDERPIPNTVSAQMVENTRVTPQGHWQDVRHIILTAPGHIPYIPGDIVCITPKNFATDVNSLLSLMGWVDEADLPLCFVPGTKLSLAKHFPPPNIPFLLEHSGFTLRMLLTDYLDIMTIPRRSFFANIAHFTNDPMQKERLIEFSNPKYIDEFYDYATRPRRSILEVLQEFDSVKIPWQQVSTVFPPLRGRQFSIASGGTLKRTADGGTRFDVLIAIVKYQTVIKKIRQGICTRYLSILQPGSTLKIQVLRGGLISHMEQLTQPVVLIGPGTGVAPLRSMLWEMAAMVEAFRRKDGPGSSRPPGPIVLLFGGRNRNADFFFESEWEELKKILDLQVLTAFSRDQRHKIYVQDRIRENYALFFNVLRDLEGVVYICGSSGNMPKAVREALVESIQTLGGEPGYRREEAEKYLAEMEKIGRYKQETW